MKVLILAGGLGTRIRALFPERPKSMIPFNGKPFLEHQMQILADQGFRDFVLCIGHGAEQISDYFGDGSRRGWTVEYSEEVTPLGTGGALRYAEAFFQEAVLILNGDTYFAMDYRALATDHAGHSDAIATIAVATVEDTARYGQVIVDADRRITAFREKAAAQGRGRVNAGCYIFEPEVLRYIPAGQKTSLEQQVFPALLAAGEPLYAFGAPGAFVDIGTPEGYHTLKDILQ
jgi:NDP-sugar pyrophosphorylase family protein